MANLILLYVVAITGATTLTLKFFKLIDLVERPTR